MDGTERIAPQSLPYDRDRLAALFDQLAANQPSRPEAEWETGIVGGERRRSFKALELQPDDIFLDAGCGMGGLTIPAAKQCRRAIGFDISRKALERARASAVENDVANAEFVFAALEDAGTERFPELGMVTKILVLNSLSHLPDELKVKALKGLSGLIDRPGRLVVGDLMLFEPAEKHRGDWDEIGYDGGLTDRPSTAGFLAETLESVGAGVNVERLHPLLGVVTADFT